MDTKYYLKYYNLEDQLIRQTKYIKNKSYLLSEMLEDYYDSKTEAVAKHNVSNDKKLLIKFLKWNSGHYGISQEIAETKADSFIKKKLNK